ncbi:MAG: hypothetical protein ACQEXJ_06330 [Myxococcota bacterium]
MTVQLEEADPRRLARAILEAHEGESGWLDAFSEALEAERAGQDLRRVLAVWGLTQADAARSFRVSRQAIGRWLSRGVPPARVEAVADLSAATDLLVRYLKRERIPAVVRREASALGGRSLLDLLQAGETRGILEAVRAMFGFEAVQA